MAVTKKALTYNEIIHFAVFSQLDMSFNKLSSWRMNDNNQL